MTKCSLPSAGFVGMLEKPLCLGEITNSAMGECVLENLWIPQGCFVLSLCAWIICWSIFCWGVLPVRRGLCSWCIGQCSTALFSLHWEMQHCCVLPALGQYSPAVFSLHWQLCSQMQTTCPDHAGAASRCPELCVCSQLALELLIIVKIKGGSVCIVYSREEQCKISSAAVEIHCYFWLFDLCRRRLPEPQVFFIFITCFYPPTHKFLLC